MTFFRDPKPRPVRKTLDDPTSSGKTILNGQKKTAGDRRKWQNPVLFFLTILLCGIAYMPTSGLAHAEKSIPDPVALYGKEILFDVRRNGENVGFHSVLFDQKGPAVSVRSLFQLEIRFLFVTAYRYRYESNEYWQEGKLLRLHSRVDDDGDKFVISAEHQPPFFQISGPDGRIETAQFLYPTTHWNAAVIQKQSVLNTLTGQINQVSIFPSAREKIETERGPVWATRYVYSGDLDTEVWYDADGRWVKMKFKGRDGSDIEYVCRRCQGGEEGNLNHAG